VEFNARNAYDALVSAQSAPAGEVAGVDVVQLARDVVLAEQEFRRSGEYLSGERAAEAGRERGVSDWAKGLGWGALAVASVTPFGTLGKLGRAARLGEDVFSAQRVAARAGEASVDWRGASRVDYPETFEPRDFENYKNVFTRRTSELRDPQYTLADGSPAPMYETVFGERGVTSGSILASDFFAGRERLFHGTLSADTAESILANGLRASRGDFGSGVYGTTSLSEAISYAVPKAGIGAANWTRQLADEAARAAREDLRYVFEFVSDSRGVEDLTRGRRGGVGYVLDPADVPASRIAAVHVFEPTGPGRFRLVDSRVLSRELGSALEDYGVLPRMAKPWEIPAGVDGLTRSVLESARAAGMSLDEALEGVNRTRAREGLPPVGVLNA
jgi:hypothetical protein